MSCRAAREHRAWRDELHRALTAARAVPSPVHRRSSPPPRRPARHHRLGPGERPNRSCRGTNASRSTCGTSIIARGHLDLTIARRTIGAMIHGPDTASPDPTRGPSSGPRRGRGDLSGDRASPVNGPPEGNARSRCRRFNRAWTGPCPARRAALDRPGNQPGSSASRPRAAASSRATFHQLRVGRRIENPPSRAERAAVAAKNDP